MSRHDFCGAFLSLSPLSLEKNPYLQVTAPLARLLLGDFSHLNCRNPVRDANPTTFFLACMQQAHRKTQEKTHHQLPLCGNHQDYVRLDGLCIFKCLQRKTLEVSAPGLMIPLGFRVWGSGACHPA